MSRRGRPGSEPTPRTPADDAPAGVARLLKRRARRVPATYLLGRDDTAWLPPRLAARLLSAYERAWLRALPDVLLVDLPFLDEPVLWFCRRLIFVLAKRPRGDDDASLDFAVPTSGWRGNLLVVAVWAGLLTGLIRLLRR